MTSLTLTPDELTALIERVFLPRATDRKLAILLDLPDAAMPDSADWKERRALAAGWADQLRSAHSRHGLDVNLFLYRNVRANNADLPPAAWRHGGGEVPDRAEDLAKVEAEAFTSILGEHSLALAPTELSATAPLKMMAPALGFRAATMPGFSPAMVPALRLDYTEVNRRVLLLKGLLDRANLADMRFAVQGAADAELRLDLRHRTAHASGGLLPEPGTAGNLPSGEAYIVPYEGEIDGDATGSVGVLPVQFGDEVVLFRIEANTAVGVMSSGPNSRRWTELLRAEPATGNLAELGLGVLGDFDIKPIGEVLLDEKLGVHIAFGRSEHFGGQVGPDRFSTPEAVVHQDYVYIPELQPRVVIASADLELDDGSRLELVRDGEYVIEF